jgi:hypothetical protein
MHWCTLTREIKNRTGEMATGVVMRLWAAFVVLPLLATMCAAQPVGYANLVGLWLAAPDSYDIWTERGIEIAAYPVLRISPEGKFTLYRLRAICEPDGPDGKPYRSDSAEKAAACAAARERSTQDGFRAAYARQRVTDVSRTKR